MTDDDRVIELLADANPVSVAGRHDPHESAEPERILRRVLSSAPSRRSRRPIVLPALSVLVALAVVAVFLGVGRPDRSGAPSRATVKIVLRAQPTAQTSVVTPAVMARELGIVRERLGSVFHNFRVTLSGSDRIVAVVRDAGAGSRARILALSTTAARLYFYDWEANTLTGDGRTVASQLQAEEPIAMTISQGAGGAPPGDPGAGGVPLYQAVKLASSRSLVRASSKVARLGPQYYLFGAPGSSACEAAAMADQTRTIHGAHCLLGGPAPKATDLGSDLPAGVTKAQVQQLVVPQGTVVLQAANPSASDHIPFDSPAARFYVLKDNVSLTGSEITKPRQSTDESGSPDVEFGFSSEGQHEFTELTARIAKRGALVSRLGQTLDQHIAVVVDQQLLTIPSIDYKVYPDGVIGGGGADITGGFTGQSARDLATELRLGALPVNLAPVH